MKLLILKYSVLLCVVFLLLTATFATSCKKDEDCHGQVTVLDSLGHPVSGATVSLKVTNNSLNTVNLPSETTNASGVASFTIILPGVFQIVATSPLYPGKVGTGVLILDQPQSSDNVTVTL